MKHDSLQCCVGGGLRCTFGNERVSVRAGEGAVDLADQLHVVEEGVEGVEVGEAHHVGGAASCSLEKQPKSVRCFCSGRLHLDRIIFSEIC